MSGDPQNDPARAMPNSSEAEKAALSCLLQLPDEVGDEYRDRGMSDDWFYAKQHKLIWRAIRSLQDEGKPVDVTTLFGRLEGDGVLEEAGDAAGISDLYSCGASPAHARHYADQIEEMHARRQMISAAQRILERAWVSGDPTEGATWRQEVEMAQGLLFDLVQGSDTRSKVTPVRHVVVDVVEDMEGAFKNRGHVTRGIATGFTDIDRTFMGLRPGQLWIVAGRPAMGKSAFGANVAENVATGTGHYKQFDQPPLPVLWVSLEMSNFEIVQRMVMGSAGVDLMHTRDGLMKQHDMPALVRASDEIGKSKLHLLDTPGLTIQELRNLARRHVPALGIKLLCIDYLQLLKSSTKQAQGSRTVEVSEVAYGLKALAKELGIPILAIAQLGRDAEKRKGSKPQMSDLRESGDIENAADIISAMYRRGYYDEEADPEEAEHITLKQRSGPVGTQRLKWTGKLARFASVNADLYSRNYDGKPAHASKGEDDSDYDLDSD